MGVIGLTGGIGSGKTLVSDVLCSLGADIIDADAVTRELYLPGSQILKEIADNFGNEFIAEDGFLERRKFREYIFADENKVNKLNNIVHPAIRREMTKRLFGSRNEHQILVVPLLLETGYNDLCDEIWVVALNNESQLNRVMQRDNVTESDAKMMIDAQMPLAEKIRYADCVIDNNGGIKSTIRQTKKAYKKFIKINY